VLRLADEPAAVGRVFNVGNPEEISILDLAQRVRAAVDPAAEIRFVSYEEAYEEGFEDLDRRVPDVGRIREAIGYEPTLGIDEIVPRVVEETRRALSEGGGGAVNGA